jgi:pimeloyl-ACP methyl ester carboxylesterase
MNRLFLCIALLLPFNLHAQQTRALTSKLTPCHVANVDEEVLCGTYEVFENRAVKTGRKINLNIVVLPAKTSDVEPDPLVFLAGGGVAPATGYAGYFSIAFSDLRQHRDILLIDQRGTGGSNPLTCDLQTDPANVDYRDDARFVEAIRRCRMKVEQKADLQYYTTPLAMDDLDEVREWLGYSRLNLYGASYGTGASVVYARQHPDHVRTITLQGVMPLDVPVWLEYPKSAQQALDHVFNTCAQQKSCHDAFPNLPNEFRVVMKRLADKPIHVKTKEAESGEDVDVLIDSEVLAVFVSRVLYSAERIHDLPLMIHLAYSGDYQPLAKKLAVKPDTSIPKGVYLSIVCAEEIPKFNPADLAAASAVSFLGSFRITREVLACKQWPQGWLPKDYRAPVKSDAPALVMNGSLDHVTPPRYGQHVAQSLTNSKHLILPNRGHNDTDPCVAGIVTAFISAGNLNGLDTSCLAKTEDLSFALRVEELQ